MKVLIYGTGGVGGYFGVRLAQHGNDVTFIARGAHLAAMRSTGLLLKSPKGDHLVQPINATDTLPDSNFDLILICVKSYHLDEVAKQLAGIVTNSTVVIPLLNGIESVDVLKKYLPNHSIMGGLCKVVSMIEKPGVIVHKSYEPTIVFGELDNTITSRAKHIEAIFTAAELKVTLSDQIEVEVWNKFMYISTISALGALTRGTVGEMLEIPEVKQMMLNLAMEIRAIALKKGIALADDIIERQFKIIKSQPYDTTSSLQRDFLSGRPSELEAQNGAVVRLSKELGVATPTNNFVYYSLLIQDRKSRTDH